MHLKGMKVSWRLTFNTDPKNLFQFTAETLAPFMLHLHPVGPIGVRAHWSLRLEMERLQLS